MGNEGKLLEASHLTKVFRLGGFRKRRLTAVDDVHFHIPSEKPTLFTLIGESGSGKTTTARMILGFLKPTSGEVLYQGKNIWKSSKDDWARYRKDVQAVFQDPYSTFNPLHKVDHVLRMPIQNFKLASLAKDADELISKGLEVAGLRLEEIGGKYPHQLSGGQRQRIMLARAFMLKPKIIVADEPVSMIDASLRASLLNTMLGMKDKEGISFIYITHDLSTAYYITDIMAVMYRGAIVEMGLSERLVDEPLHPYLRMLIESIPVPNPKHRWKETVKLAAIELADQSKLTEGCKFYDRCPERSEKCAKERPKLTDVDSNHMVACMQYGEANIEQALA